jgi:putative FmdB family regulatory protein
MPIFEFACRKCGNEFETLIRASTVPTCPACASNELEKKLSVFAAATAGAATEIAPGPCGTCGHPGGPGSCALD